MMLVRLCHWMFRIKVLPVYAEDVRGKPKLTNVYRVPTLWEAITGISDT